MELDITDLRHARGKLEEEDQKMINRCVYNLCGMKVIASGYGNRYMPFLREAESKELRSFGEKSALELLAKLGQYFLKTGYGSGE